MEFRESDSHSDMSNSHSLDKYKDTGLLRADYHLYVMCILNVPFILILSLYTGDYYKIYIQDTFGKLEWSWRDLIGRKDIGFQLQEVFLSE
mgnify:FL=1